jgi:hypothetical protein
VLVRRDLSRAQQAVQACHAAMEAARAFLPPSLEHPSLVICGIRDGPRLLQCLARLEAAGIRHRAFYEPDLNHQLTAVATEPVAGSQRELFRRYSLLR